MIDTNMKTTLCTLLAAALLCGCAAPKMNTPSGANEVTISAPMSGVRSIVFGALLDRGYLVTRADDLVVEARKDAGLTPAIFLGTASDPNATRIARFNLMETDAGVRVVVRAFMVAGGRDLGEITGGRAKTQEWLERIKQTCEAKRYEF